ncbi:ligand-binding sensor domain-containing protein [Sulfidibacter corallicola]|uniref:histidine kinase n=1 Tax=Sulfidibacter corallicola TaxID=2818388 RepID=A0A8A4TI58_SULCO|nr:two-component regulator propeller domain-containing protein [Sulfidibacter corallicola]QTD49240.1 hypothetical protein J3U87_26950 [Sulfidibacter corallicola]
MFSRYLAQCLILHFLASTLWLNAKHSPWNPPRFKRIGLEQGLSHRSVYALHQDHQGFLWVGTQNGLDRYDGYQFRSYKSEATDPSTLSSDNVSCIYEDEDGYLWIGTWGGGLNRYDPNSDTFKRFNSEGEGGEALRALRIQRIHRGQGDILWLSTYANGLVRFHRQTGRAQSFFPQWEEDDRQSRVWDLAIDANGLIWVGTERGLYTFNAGDETFMRFEAQGQLGVELNQAQVRTLFLSKLNDLWIGTDRRLFRLELNAGRLVREQPIKEDGTPLEPTNINTIISGSAGRLLVGTLFFGLFEYDQMTGRWAHHLSSGTDAQSLSHHDVRSLLIDRTRVLWVGTRGGGLSKLDTKRPKFELYRHVPGKPHSLPAAEVRAMTTQPDGTLWVGTRGGGLSRIDRRNDTAQHYLADSAVADSLSHSWVYALLWDRRDRLWVATYAGLNLMQEGGGFRRYFHDPERPDSLLDNQAESLLETHDGEIWVGTARGISRFRDGHFINHPCHPTMEGAPRGTHVYTIFQDSQGTIWVGTAHGGLNQFNAERQMFSSHQPIPGDPSSLPNATVLSIGENGKGLWVGSFGGGLSLLDRESGRFRHYGLRDGLPNNIVYGILADHEDQLWISTNKGLCRFDTNEETFREFGIDDGLQSEQFSVGAYHKSGDELFFGGPLGLNSLIPRDLHDHLNPPHIALTRFRVMDRERRPPLGQETVALEHSKNFLFFEFSALDFTAPEKNLYQHYLEGYDRDWSPPGRQRVADYPLLAPGLYRFRVRAANHDGVWNEEGLTLSIRILPPFYRTPLAYALYLAALFLFAGILLQARRKRLEQKARVERILERQKMAEESSRSKSAFLAQMSHELRTPLNHIIGYSEILEEEMAELIHSEQDRGQLNTDLLKIRSAAYYQLSLVNNLLDFTKIESGDIQLFLERFPIRELVESVVSQLRALLKKQGNQLLLEFEPANPGNMVADIIKLKASLLNLLNNANKFTVRGQISLRVFRYDREGEEWVGFQVEDTGIGIKEHQLQHLFREFTQMEDHNKYGGTGLGLYVTRCFCRLMGGSIEVASQYRRGTTFTMYLPAVVGTENVTIRKMKPIIVEQPKTGETHV